MKVTLFCPKVTFLLRKSYTLRTEVVDGSNESLYYPDEELGPFLKSVTKVTPFPNKDPILHGDGTSFHLSHQPPLSVMCHFLCSESDTFLPKSDIFTT